MTSTAAHAIRKTRTLRDWLSCAFRVLPPALAVALLAGCAIPSLVTGEARPNVPLLQGWFEGAVVFYITTDVSDADVAKEKGANFAPRLAMAMPVATPGAPIRSSVDKVYAVTNFQQSSIFASAPRPLGHLNREAAYSPLWQMVKVTWRPGASARVLTSEEAVLDAAEKGLVELQVTRVVLNCPIVPAPA
jgi:hypothetical protein